ncbi:NDR1 HIN1 12 [Olea europaea subsp. europaea]|uniref:NDR1 HIN1 12 n=1 Tax=Olea europaea subsp. europaea TaxID=158383 RepID=A0A8S0U0A2_OLEEU|nr:NDR1 HIN1 12 [Olea europaea subsp. europaea]
MTQDDLKRQPPSPRHGPFASQYVIKDRHRALSTFIVIFLVLAGITALVVWLVYRPHDPKFKVVSLVIYDLNFTSPPYMFATMQFTVVTRNPNEKVSFYYDQLFVFVSYKNQVITPPSSLSPLYYDSKSTVALSPVLGGGVVAASIKVANGLVMDRSYGLVNLKLILTGKVRSGPLIGSSECQVDA